MMLAPQSISQCFRKMNALIPTKYVQCATPKPAAGWKQTPGKDQWQQSYARRLLPIMVGCLLLSLPVSEAFPGARIVASRVDPQPNYHFTQDAGDVAQLTDGQTVLYPLWKNRAAVGWARATPIKIWLTLHGVPPTQSQFSGRLSIHTVVRSKSGIQIPNRVDVYTSDGKSLWAHVNGMQLKPSEFKDGQDHWLHMDISSVSSKLLVVIHASGEYFFTDEIIWEDTPAPPVASERPNLKGPQQAVTDSLSRMKKNFTASTLATPQQILQWGSSFGGEPIVAWVENPWDTLTSTPSLTRIQDGVGKSVRLSGIQNEYETSCIGILNPTSADRMVSLSWDGDATVAQAVQVRSVKAVMAADGQVVYDALIPHALSEPINMAPNTTTYLWLTVDLRRLPVGSSTASLELSSSKSKLRIPFEIHVANTTLQQGEIGAVNWAYTKDLPIWQDPKAAVNDLVAHRINVFVIPASDLPQPTTRSTAHTATFPKLSAYLQLFGTKSFYLLYFQWIPERFNEQGLSWLDPSSGFDPHQRRRAVEDWLKLIRDTMAQAGVKESQWALYPVDEPSGKHRAFMQFMLSLFKELAPTVQIYANPIDTPSNPTSVSDLQALEPYVDIWQPDISFAEKSGKGFFQSLRKKWWIYGNPTRPAKSQAPMHYRSISWRAWQLGASGVGFWSYSNTGGTSAWDDLDGRMPDWAVVYEGDPLISSRRWEAFREGVEDFLLLRYLDPQRTLLEQQFKEYDNREISAYMNRSREALLARSLNIRHGEP